MGSPSAQEKSMGLECPYDLFIEKANWEGLQRRILTVVQRGQFGQG